MRKGPYFEPTAGSLVPVIRILVVEDEKGTADRVAYELRTLFGELAIVDVAYTLNQAISLLKKNVYHLILLDGVMPREESEKPELEYTKVFYITYVKDRIPTIAFSAHYNNEMLCWGDFAKACFFKSSKDLNILINTVWSYLFGHRSNDVVSFNKGSQKEIILPC